MATAQGLLLLLLHMFARRQWALSERESRNRNRLRYRGVLPLAVALRWLLQRVHQMRLILTHLFVHSTWAGCLRKLMVRTCHNYPADLIRTYHILQHPLGGVWAVGCFHFFHLLFPLGFFISPVCFSFQRKSLLVTCNHNEQHLLQLCLYIPYNIICYSFISHLVYLLPAVHCYRNESKLWALLSPSGVFLSLSLSSALCLLSFVVFCFIFSIAVNKLHEVGLLRHGSCLDRETRLKTGLGYVFWRVWRSARRKNWREREWKRCERCKIGLK